MKYDKKGNHLTQTEKQGIINELLKQMWKDGICIEYPERKLIVKYIKKEL